MDSTRTGLVTMTTAAVGVAVVLAFWPDALGTLLLAMTGLVAASVVTVAGSGRAGTLRHELAANVVAAGIGMTVAGMTLTSGHTLIASIWLAAAALVPVAATTSLIVALVERRTPTVQHQRDAGP